MFVLFLCCLKAWPKVATFSVYFGQRKPCLIACLQTNLLHCYLLYIAGVAHSFWDDFNAVDTYTDGLDDTSLEMERRIPEFSNFNADNGLSKEDTLLSLLKRASVLLPESYRRSSRPNRLIIPFYSYGYDYRNFRSRPRGSHWQQRQSYDQSPWNIGGSGGSRYGDRFRSRRYSAY